MIISKNDPTISPEEYLEGEKFSSVKHEYIRGTVYAMVGASDAHVTISLNLASALRNHLRGSGCRVYMADMKARIESLEIFYYPDVMVSCDQRDRNFNYFKRYPKLIVEVLSDSTEGFDRGDKFADYRQLETLEEYVLISQTRVRFECFRRNAEGLWVLHPYGEGEEIYLASVDFHFPIADIFEDVLLAQPENSTVGEATKVKGERK